MKLDGMIRNNSSCNKRVQSILYIPVHMQYLIREVQNYYLNELRDSFHKYMHSIERACVYTVDTFRYLVTSRSFSCNKLQILHKQSVYSNMYTCLCLVLLIFIICYTRVFCLIINFFFSSAFNEMEIFYFAFFTRRIISIISISSSAERWI